MLFDLNVNHRNISLAIFGKNVIVINIETRPQEAKMTAETLDRPQAAIPLTDDPANSTQTEAAQPSIWQRFWRQAWSDSPWLTVTGILMLADIPVCLIGLAVDPTVITGAPAWIKPLKFAVSTALFSLTIALMVGQFRRFAQLARWSGRILAVMLVLEVGLIQLQAARHTTSHFNIALPLDQAIYGIMGIGIAIALAVTALIFLLSLWENFADRPLAWAIRLSLALALAGMGTGILMTLPTPQQLAAAQASHSRSLPRVGGHTVGAPDGGPGMPLTGWSADHGDLRIAHFVGLHAMQVLLLGWWLTANRPGWTSRHRVRLIAILTVSITAAFALVLAQALHGQPLLTLNLSTAISWSLWLAATALALATLNNPLIPSRIKETRQS
jgi:hypothetical protein